MTRPLIFDTRSKLHSRGHSIRQHVEGYWKRNDSIIYGDKYTRNLRLRDWSVESDSSLAWILNFEDVAHRPVACVSFCTPDSASVINNFEEVDKVLNTIGTPCVWVHIITLANQRFDKDSLIHYLWSCRWRIVLSDWQWKCYAMLHYEGKRSSLLM